jgi:hypothetical protein
MNKRMWKSRARIHHGGHKSHTTNSLEDVERGRGGIECSSACKIIMIKK